MTRSLPFLCLLVVAACVDDPIEMTTSAASQPDASPPRPDGPVIDAGPPQPRSYPAVSITVGSAGVVGGYAVAPDLVVTSKRWLPPGTSPAQVTVSSGFLRPTRQAIALTVSGYMPMAYIQLATPLEAPIVPPDSSRTPAELAGAYVGCYLPGGGSKGLRFAAVDGEREMLGEPGWAIRDYDVGVPCFESWDANAPLVGFVLSYDAAADRARLFVNQDTRWYRDHMLKVAELRRQHGNGYRISTRATDGTNLCLDVAGGNPYDRVALNAYPCNGGNNERFYPDATNAWGTAWVNAQTGACVDVPGGSDVSGTALQMTGCNGGKNQALAENPNHTWSPMSSPLFPFGANQGKRSLCLAPTAGSAPTASRLIQTGCSFSATPPAQQVWTVTAL